MNTKPVAKKSRGRPALKTGVETVPLMVRLTVLQRDKLLRLAGKTGAAAWIRDKIDKAKEPAA